MAYFENDLVLVDIKTTYTISDMTCGVQLEAYAQALSSMGVGIQKKIILHLKRMGNSTLENILPLMQKDGEFSEP